MHVFTVIAENQDPPVELLVAELAPGVSMGATFEAIYKTGDADARKRAALVIVRPPVRHPIDPAILERIIAAKGDGEWPVPYRFLADALRNQSDAFARVMEKPVHILASHNYGHFLSGNVNPTASRSPLESGELSSAAAIENIRATEIDRIVETGRAKLPRIPGVFYRAPSKRLMRSFLRVGNIQRSRAVLDAIFFWLIPHLQGCVGLITDTWSISSISMNASRRLSVYAHAEPTAPCPVEMLSHYHDGSPAQVAEAVEIIEGLLARAMEAREGNQGNAQDVARVIFLISATHTGTLAKRLRELLSIRRIPVEAVHFVALFKVGAEGEPIEAIRDLTVGSSAEDFAPVTPGEGAAVEVIDIDEQVYFPLQYHDVKHGIRAADTAAMKDFFLRYKDIDLVRVHKTLRDDGPSRHHAVWINTLALIGHQHFQRQFIERIRALDPVPKVIITPRHRAAEELGKLALGVLRDAAPAVQRFTHSTLFLCDRPGDAEIAQALAEVRDTEAILILDDAFITGTRLSEFSKHLRGVNGRIHYLVGIARPPGLAAWDRGCRTLRFRASPDRLNPLAQHTVAAVETIVLPDWHRPDCPWCAEMSLYRGRAAQGDEALSDEMLRSRLAMLTQCDLDGLAESLFLTIPGLPEILLARNSVFVDAPASQAVVFAAVAGAIQHLRTLNDPQKPPLGPRHFPISTVIDDELYLAGC